MDLAVGDADRLVVCPRPTIDEGDGTVGLDLHLGSWFAFFRDSNIAHLKIGSDTPEEKIVNQHYVPLGSEFYLHPGQFVLGVTLEWVGLPYNLAAHVVGKSSWGRRGLIIATATGVQPRFTGCLTLEIANVGRAPLAIPAGSAICQLFLEQVEEPVSENQAAGAHSGFRKPRVGPVKSDWVLDRLMERNRMVDKLMRAPDPD